MVSNNIIINYEFSQDYNNNNVDDIDYDNSDEIDYNNSDEIDNDNSDEIDNIDDIDDDEFIVSKNMGNNIHLKYVPPYNKYSDLIYEINDKIDEAINIIKYISKIKSKYIIKKIKIYECKCLLNINDYNFLLLSNILIPFDDKYEDILCNETNFIYFYFDKQNIKYNAEYLLLHLEYYYNNQLSYYIDTLELTNNEKIETIKILDNESITLKQILKYVFTIEELIEIGLNIKFINIYNKNKKLII